MSEFILEEEIQKVINPMTKGYLKEVISSYRNENYRACVVVLYTVVIFDLLQKIIVLKDIYNDGKAEQIINDITKHQKDKPNSSEWEGNLIEEISKKTNIISAVEKKELLYLKEERNYAAHPIISIYEDKLDLKPITKETAADLIRKAFEIVFLRDAILAKNLVNDIVKDLNEYYSRVGSEGIQQFLKSKYFKRMTQERKDGLFKALWKFVFVLKDDDCNKNRESNYLGVKSLYEEDRTHYRQLIKENKDYYFSKLEIETVSSGSHYSLRILFFIKFIEDFPEMYGDLNDYAKNILQQSINKMYIEKNVIKTPMYLSGCKDGYDNPFKKQVVLQSRAVFLSKDINEHFENIFKMLGNYQETRKNWSEDNNYTIFVPEDLKVIFNQAEYMCCTGKFFKFLIKYCTGANTYPQALLLFDYIKMYIKYFKEDHYYYTLAQMDKNSQFYNNKEKDCMLDELKNMYETKFKCKLADTNEEKFLYSRLYSKNNNYDIEKLLEIIEKRAFSFFAYQINDAIEQIKENKASELSALLKKKNKDSYTNIISVLSDKNDYSYKEYYLTNFTELFLT